MADAQGGSRLQVLGDADAMVPVVGLVQASACASPEDLDAATTRRVSFMCRLSVFGGLSMTDRISPKPLRHVAGTMISGASSLAFRGKPQSSAHAVSIDRGDRSRQPLGKSIGLFSGLKRSRRATTGEDVGTNLCGSASGARAWTWRRLGTRPKHCG